MPDSIQLAKSINDSLSATELAGVKRIIFYQNDIKNTFLGISFDTIFTVLTTILIFILGYWVTKKIESSKEKKRLRELEEYFLKNIEMLEAPLVLQRQAFISISRVLKEEKEQHYVIDDVTGLSGGFLDDVDNKDLYKIFVRNKKGNIKLKTELYRKLRSNLDYILAIKKGFITDSLKLMENEEKYSTKYKESIKALNDLLDDLIHQRKKEKSTPEDFPALFNIAQVRTSWIEKNTTETESYLDLFFSFANFIKPAQEICKASQNDETVGIIIKPLMDCVYAYHNICELRRFYRRHFVLDGRGLQKSMHTIKSVIKDFSSM